MDLDDLARDMALDQKNQKSKPEKKSVFRENLAKPNSKS